MKSNYYTNEETETMIKLILKKGDDDSKSGLFRRLVRKEGRRLGIRRNS